MPVRFRTKLALATAGVAALVVLLAATVIATAIRRQTSDRIERGLVSEARLAAELLSHRAAERGEAELQEQATALAADIDARVTLIAADGRVVGDSSLDSMGLSTLENHASRPEVAAAHESGLGMATRFSDTVGTDMLYVAARVRHPSIATVRLALPLTEIQRQLRTIWQVTLSALLLSGLGAFAFAWGASALLVRRLDRLADGARRYADGTAAAPPPDYEADEIGTVAKVLDDVVRRLGDRAQDLARDRAEIEAILAGMVEGVLVIDAQARVRLINDAARRMLRVEGEARGRHYLEYVRHPAAVGQLDAVRRGDPAPSAERAVVYEGARAFVARAAPVVSDAGRGAVLVLHDITDLHRADQIRRDFVANVSHELRTPLTSIRGYVEALLDEPLHPERSRKFLEIIARHTARMERLAQDLLRLAQLEAGQEPPEFSSCDVAALFRSVIADLQLPIDRTRHRVEVQVEPAAAVIEADPQQLHDAVRNLVENAVVYSPEGSVITLHAGYDGDRVALTVADTGPGIPDADLSRIFERFYRVDKARSQESGGTGLGLAIVKHLVERMQGSVRAENRPGGGAIFTILLPHREARAAKQGRSVRLR